MGDVVLDFLRAAAGVTGSDPDAPVDVRAMLERIGFVEDTDPDSAAWTVDGLVEDHGAVVPFHCVPAVLIAIATDTIGPEWEAGMSAFFEEACKAFESVPLPTFLFHTVH